MEMDIKRMSIVKIAQMFNESILSKLYYAYIAQCYMWDNRYDDETLDRIINLAIYAEEKSEISYSIYSFIDSIIMLMDTGKTLDELEKLDRWDLLITLDSVRPY